MVCNTHLHNDNQICLYLFLIIPKLSEILSFPSKQLQNKMELNNYMRTHMPKKKLNAFPANKKTFANLYSRFKKNNPEQVLPEPEDHTQTPKLSKLVHRESYSLEAKSQSSKSRINEMAFSTISNNYTNKTNTITQYQIYDELFIEGLQLEKKDIYNKYVKVSQQLEFVSKQFHEFRQMMKQKVRDYEMESTILTKQNQYLKIQMQYVKKVERKQGSQITVGCVETQTLNNLNWKSVESQTVEQLREKQNQQKNNVGEIQLLERKIQQLDVRNKDLIEQINDKQVVINQKQVVIQSMIDKLQQVTLYNQHKFEQQNLLFKQQNSNLKLLIDQLEKQIEQQTKNLIKEVKNQQKSINQRQTQTQFIIQKQQCVQSDMKVTLINIQTQTEFAGQNKSNQINCQQIQTQTIIQTQDKYVQTVAQYAFQQQNAQLSNRISCQSQTTSQFGQNQISELKIKIEQITHNMNQVVNINNQLKVQKHIIQAQNKQLISKIQEIQQKVSFKNQQLEGYRNQVNDLMEQIHKMEQRQYLVGQKQQQLDNNNKLIQDEQIATSNIEELEQLSFRNNQLINKLSSIQDENELEKQSLLNEIMRLQHQCEEYESKILTLQKNYDIMASSLQHLQSSNQKDRDQYEQFKVKLVGLQQENHNKQKYIQQLGKEISDKGREIHKLKNEDCEECKNLEFELAAMRKQFVEKLKEAEFDNQRLMGRERQRTANNF